MAMLTLFFVNSLGRSAESLHGLRWVSPYFYYDRTQALLPGHPPDWAALLVLVAVTLVLTALSALALQVRDVGAPLLRVPGPRRPPRYRPSSNPALELPVVEGVYEQRWSLVA